MSCKNFKNKYYLYFSGELPVWQHFLFKRHLRRCKACSDEWFRIRITLNRLEKLPLLIPSGKTRDTILTQAGAMIPNVGEKRSDHSLSVNRLFKGKLALVFPGAIIVTAGLFLVFKIVVVPKLIENNRKMVYQWNDNFLTETESINQEINRLESGELITGVYNGETTDLPAMEPDGSLPEDILRIKNEIEALIYTMD